MTTPVIPPVSARLTELIAQWRGPQIAENRPGMSKCADDLAAVLAETGKTQGKNFWRDVALQAWHDWKKTLPLAVHGGFTHSDGVRFVNMLDDLFARTPDERQSQPLADMGARTCGPTWEDIRALPSFHVVHHTNPAHGNYYECKWCKVEWLESHGRAGHPANGCLWNRAHEPSTPSADPASAREER